MGGKGLGEGEGGDSQKMQFHFLPPPPLVRSKTSEIFSFCGKHDSTDKINVSQFEIYKIIFKLWDPNLSNTTKLRYKTMGFACAINQAKLSLFPVSKLRLYFYFLIQLQPTFHFYTLLKTFSGGIEIER